MDNKKTIEDFVKDWGNETNNDIQIGKYPNRLLTKEEIDKEFEEIERLYQESVEKAHKSGKYK
jgi:hypothetical protein